MYIKKGMGIMNNDVSPVVTEVIKAMDIKRSLMRVEPDKKELKQFTKEELEKTYKAFDYVLDMCNGLFSANQECMLMDMRKVFINEIELREVE